MGFKQKTRSVYKWGTAWKNGKWRQTWIHVETDFCASADYDEFPRPTHAEAIEWLRKYKKVLIGVRISDNWHGRYRALAEYFENGYDRCFFGNSGRDYKTPFKATEAALKFVLCNLLKN